jgi:hypothetical protein
MEEINKEFSLKRDVDLPTPAPAATGQNNNRVLPAAKPNQSKLLPAAVEAPTAKSQPQPPASKQTHGSLPAPKAQTAAQSNLKQFNTKFSKVAVGGGFYAVVPAGQKLPLPHLQGSAQTNSPVTLKPSSAQSAPYATQQSSATTKLKGAAQMSPSLRRFEVPMWLAGVWQRRQATETARTQLPSGRQLKPIGQSIAQVTDNFGTVKDKSGHIYQLFDPAHSTGQVDRGGTVDVEHVFDYKLQILDDRRVLVIARAWHAQMKKNTHQVVSAYQDEEFNTYTSLGPGNLRTDSSVKVFDVHGKPTLITRSVSNEIRIQGP